MATDGSVVSDSEDPSSFENYRMGLHRFNNSEQDVSNSTIEETSENRAHESSSSVNQPNGRRKRGQYKLYLTPSGSEDSIDVPRTTKWRRLQATGEHESCPQEDGESELVNAGIDLNAAGKNFYY